MWPNLRAQQINGQAEKLGAKRRLRVCFVRSPVSNLFHYLPDDLQASLSGALDSDRIELVPPPENADIYIFPAHGSNLSAGLWKFRNNARDALVAVWFWDNHLAHLNNLSTALVADFIFASHAFCEDYLINPASVLGQQIPACCAQWTAEEAGALFTEFAGIGRSDQLLVNYVDYPFSWRHGLLRELQTSMPEADVLLMSEGDRSRYFDKSRRERMQEWCSYKTALVLPVNEDLSTRLFDGLAAGVVLIIPDRVADLDRVIPPARQAELGIVRFGECDPEAIRRAHQRALAVFAEQGTAGVRRRHAYVLQEHMLANRVSAVTQQILTVMEGASHVEFTCPEGTPCGLRLVGV